MSIRYSGDASRSFIIGSSEWPPASSRASGPSSVEQLERVVDARGPLVFKRCWNLQSVVRSGPGILPWTPPVPGSPLLSGILPFPYCGGQRELSDRLGEDGQVWTVVMVDPVPVTAEPDDPRAAAVVRSRRSARVGQGRGGRARGHRAGGVGGGGGAAQGARRRAVRAQRPRDRADARRPPAGRAGAARSSAWPSRRGVSVQESPGQPRQLQVAATSIVAEHIGPLIDAFSSRGSGLEITVETGPGRIVRRHARAPPRRHRARARTRASSAPRRSRRSRSCARG